MGNRAGEGDRCGGRSNLCLAARDQDDEQIAVAANALGQAIVDTLLEVFDGLIQEQSDN